MPTTPETYASRLARLHADLVEQGRRVQALLEASFEAVFTGDVGRARRIGDQDDVIDRVDVEIERAAVQLLEDVAGASVSLKGDQLRELLTIVKINNELERTADAAVAIATSVEGLANAARPIPQTMRVVANSVVAILRDTNSAYDKSDVKLARVVLQCDETMERFKDQLLRDFELEIASGSMSVEFAFLLHEIAAQCDRMADHCTNIAEQVIYSVSGAIVRHTEGGWQDIPQQN